MKKKTITILSLASLMILTACGGKGSSTSSSPVSTAPSITESSGNSSSNSSGSAVEPSVTFDTISDLYEYLSSEGMKKDIAMGKSYTRENEIFETVLYGTRTTTIKEKGESFASNTFYAEGTEDVSYVDSELPSQNYETKDSYQTLRILEDNVFYQVIDYANGKDRDDASKTPYSESLATQIAQASSINSVYYLLYYYNLLIADHVIAGFDNIVPVIDEETGSSNYTIDTTWNDTSSGYTYNYGAKIDLTLDKDGYLTSFTFDYLEQLDDSGNTKIVSSITDSFVVTLGEKDAYTEQKLNPLDYFMTSYDIQLLWNDGILEANHVADANNFPIGQLVRVQAVNISPEKAVDTDLEIVDSSNQDVIKITKYDNYKPTIEAVGEGTTTLTVRSESGIEKTIDVTVKAPAMESIDVNLYVSHKYKGEEENIYVFVNPDNTMDTYTVTASDNIKLTKDENGDYTATYLETGDAWVRATSNNNPEVYDQVDFVIEEKKTAEEVKANIVGTWTGGLPNMDGSSMIENAATVEFTSEDAAEAGYKKGYFTLNSSDTGFTFIPGQKYEFTYKIDETYSRDDRVLVLISSITYVSEGGMEYTYDNNYAFFEFNGEDANIVFSLSDPNYYGYTIDLDCKKVD